MDKYFEKIKNSKDFILKELGVKPSTAVVLGSGFDDTVDIIEKQYELEYSSIPGFPLPTVEGHKGIMVFGKINNIDIVFLKGRFHYYEGYDMNEVTFFVRVLNEIGVKNLVLTNSAGGINSGFKPGDLMIIKDHVSLFMPEAPLRGRNLDEFGPRFPDMSNCYSKKLRKLAEKTAESLKIRLREGVYSYCKGPMYETPTEVKMLKLLGSDAVGMSTVPETIVANHCGMDVLGISCITNMAAGINNEILNHEEVLIKANESGKNFKQLLNKMLLDWV
jgi:purine-nucleoside phosphorylase